MFDLGIQELVVIFVVALLVFGPKKLPEIGKSLGKGMLELRKAMEGVKEQIRAETEMIERENKEAADKATERTEEPRLPDTDGKSPEPDESRKEDLHG